jgi:hypothetical protein
MRQQDTEICDPYGDITRLDNDSGSIMVLSFYYTFVLALILTKVGWGAYLHSTKGFALVMHFNNMLCRSQGRLIPLPNYVIQCLEQARRFHRADKVHVILLTNAAECGVSGPLQVTSGSPADLLASVMVVDLNDVISNRTQSFELSSKKSFLNHLHNNTEGGSGIDANLYYTSLFRFLHLEELMQASTKGWLKTIDNKVVPPVAELLLVESDNLLYSDVTLLLPKLRTHYSQLAGVVQSHLNMVASVFYVASLGPLVKMNDFFANIASDQTSMLEYTTWLGVRNRKRIVGGHPPLDERGMGLPPYIVNEMTLLRYYHDVCHVGDPGDGVRCLESLPLWGRMQGLLRMNKHADFWAHVGRNDDLEKAVPPEARDRRRNVGRALYDTAWDPGGWGQYLGGTYLLKREPGFIDLVHITGKAIVKSACRVEMKCSCFKQSRLVPPPDYSGHGARVVGDTLPESSSFVHDAFTLTQPSNESMLLHRIEREQFRENGRRDFATYSVPFPFKMKQSEDPHYTAPFVMCCANAGGTNAAEKEISWGSPDACGPWQPLVNLHMHSKNTQPFLSRSCECESY